MPRLRESPLEQLLINLLLAVPSRRVRNSVVRRLLGWPVDVQIGRGVRLQGVRGITIGRRVVVHRRTRLDLRGGIHIGDDVAISPGCAIVTADHDPDSPNRTLRLRSVTVGDRAWLATAATLLPGTVVGEGAVVGGGAVAHGRLDGWTIYAGNPALAIRARDRGAQTELRGTMQRFQ